MTVAVNINLFGFTEHVPASEEDSSSDSMNWKEKRTSYETTRNWHNCWRAKELVDIPLNPLQLLQLQVSVFKSNRKMPIQISCLRLGRTRAVTMTVRITLFCFTEHVPASEEDSSSDSSS